MLTVGIGHVFNKYIISVYKMPSKYGKKYMLMVNGYTFSERRRTYWYCTKKKVGCQVKVRTDKDLNLTQINGTHTHDPPKYHVTRDGRFVKLN